MTSTNPVWLTSKCHQALEVGLHVVVKELSSESLMGGEDLSGSGSGSSLVHPELSGWLTTGLESIVSLVDLGSLLKGVLLDNGSHEDIVGIGGESWGGDSLVVGGLVVEWGVVLGGSIIGLLDGYNHTNEGSNGEFHVS